MDHDCFKTTQIVACLWNDWVIQIIDEYRQLFGDHAFRGT